VQIRGSSNNANNGRLGTIASLTATTLTITMTGGTSGMVTTTADLAYAYPYILKVRTFSVGLIDAPPLDNGDGTSSYRFMRGIGAPAGSTEHAWFCYTFHGDSSGAIFALNGGEAVLLGTLTSWGRQGGPFWAALCYADTYDWLNGQMAALSAAAGVLVYTLTDTDLSGYTDIGSIPPANTIGPEN